MRLTLIQTQYTDKLSSVPYSPHSGPGNTTWQDSRSLTSPWQLSRFGLQDQSIRTLSQGRYTGIVATRSIAEAVFTSQLLTDIRAHNLDIDNIAE